MTKIHPDHFRVVIFGSARIKKNNPAYKQVHDLAKRIGAAGHDVVTGGGPGLMQAASEGHHAGRTDKHAHSIGLNIKLPHEQKTNRHIDIKQEFAKFSKRLDTFMRLSNVVVVAPGGVGTMLEFFYSWQLMQVQHTCKIPIIFIGDMWKGLLKWIKKHPLENELLNPADMDNIMIAKDNKQAMEIITDAHQNFVNGEKNICSNFSRYRV